MHFDTYLQTTLDHLDASRVKEAMSYSLFAGGKRVRPQLAIAAMEAYGKDPQQIYPFAAALEMIHTYSLIHDDLPAMDDDTLRRGKPTCHVAFDEATAILAGDALLSEAFYQVTLCHCDDRQKVALIKLLSLYSGANGMVLGQILDMEGERGDLTAAQLERIHENKTGRLLTIPFLAAAVLCEREADLPNWEEIGKRLGLSFQIQDDILDVTSSSAVLGKNINSDEENHKTTYVTLLGLTQAKALAAAYYEEATNLLHTLAIDPKPLLQVFEALAHRSF